MVLTDPRQRDNPIVWANDAFLSLTGYAWEEVSGRNCRMLQGPETDARAVRRLRGRRRPEPEFRCRKPDDMSSLNM